MMVDAQILGSLRDQLRMLAIPEMDDKELQAKIKEKLKELFNLAGGIEG